MERSQNKSLAFGLVSHQRSMVTRAKVIVSDKGEAMSKIVWAMAMYKLKPCVERRLELPFSDN